jgi:hypothetical protein
MYEEYILVIMGTRTHYWFEDWEYNLPFFFGNHLIHFASFMKLVLKGEGGKHIVYKVLKEQEEDGRIDDSGTLQLSGRKVYSVLWDNCVFRVRKELEQGGPQT